MQLTFNLNVESTKDKTRSIVQNIGRNILTKKQIAYDEIDIETVVHCNIYDTYKDLHKSEIERQDMSLQGVQTAKGLQVRVGAKKDAAGTAIETTVEEDCINKALKNRFSIPLDFEFLDKPIYPYGLNGKLCIKLTLNSADNVVIATGDPNATYHISDICLEYDVIISETYGEHMLNYYSSTYTIPYSKTTMLTYDNS